VRRDARRGVSRVRRRRPDGKEILRRVRRPARRRRAPGARRGVPAVRVAACVHSRASRGADPEGPRGALGGAQAGQRALRRRLRFHVHLRAPRICGSQLAEPGAIVVAEASQKLIAPYFATRALGAVPVKGKSQPVAAYELLKALEGVTRLDARAARGLSPFVGRDDALETLARAWAQVRRGRGQAVFVLGDAGIRTSPRWTRCSGVPASSPRSTG